MQIFNSRIQEQIRVGSSQGVESRENKTEESWERGIYITTSVPQKKQLLPEETLREGFVEDVASGWTLSLEGSVGSANTEEEGKAFPT